MQSCRLVSCNPFMRRRGQGIIGRREIAIRTRRAHVSTIERTGTTNLNAIGNEGILKLSKRLEAAGTSIQPHLHRDPDQVRMALRAKLLLEQ